MIDVPTLMLGWLAVFFIVSIISIVFVGANFWFHVSENVLIGATVGNLVIVAWQTLQSTAIYSLARGQYLYAIPIGLGLLLFSREFKKYSWLSNYGVAILVGTGLGISVRALVYSQLIQQITGALDDLKLGINGIISFIIVVCVVAYFLFTFDKPQQIMKPTRRVARLSMMVAFGAGYVSLLISVYAMVVSNFQKIVDVVRMTFGI